MRAVENKIKIKAELGIGDEWGGDIVLFGMPTSIPPALLSHTFVSEFPTSQGRKEKKIANSIALFIYEESLLTVFQSIRLDFRYQI